MAGNLLKIFLTMRNITSFDLVAIGIHGVLTASGIMELTYLAYFITRMECRISQDGPQILSWFNVTLLGLGVSLTTLHASTGVCIFERQHTFDPSVAVIIADLCFCLGELMYVWYIWLRSNAILKIRGGIQYQIAAGVVTIAPVVYTAQFILFCLHLYWANETQKPATMLAITLASSFSGVTVITFDWIMLLAYISFLRENQMDSMSHSARARRKGQSNRFSVIARYGRWSCVALLIALGFYIVSSVFGYESDYRNLLEACCYTALHGAFLVLAGMKVALQLCDAREAQEEVMAKKMPGSCEAYPPNAYCSSLIHYPVYLPPNESIAAVEASLKNQGRIDLLLKLNSTKEYSACVQSFLEYSCYSLYPACIGGEITQTGCAANCDRTATLCYSLFLMAGKLNALPKCGPMSIDSLNVNTCLGTANGKEEITLPSPPRCPSILLPNPNFNMSNPTAPLPEISGQRCTGPCCLPCPTVYQFYPNGRFNGIYESVRPLGIMSALGCLILLASHALSAKDIEYPGTMMAQFIFGALLCHVVSFANNAPTLVVCRDAITEATQQNSGLCLVQGILFVFATYYTVAYACAFSIALHFLVVHSNMKLANHQWTLFALIVSVGVAVSATFAGLGQYRTTGFTCLFSPGNAATWLIFVPLGLISVPSLCMNVWTVAYILKVHWLAPSGPIRQHRLIVDGSEGKSGDSSLSASVRASSVGLETGRVGAAKAAKAALRKMAGTLKASGRSMGLTIVFDIIFCVNWSVYLYLNFVFTTVPSPKWQNEWQACVATGASQSECAKITQAYLPPAEILFAVEALMESLGLMFFIVLCPKAFNANTSLRTVNSSSMSESSYQKNKKGTASCTGFEPARPEDNALAGHRVNHSANRTL
ncbi:hypothetical protein CcCBS67573_g08043 [Chytriomyces confervae]|uniref:FZ domain-containing protein n=1 Tax=Chytriomyces confervae TaxID=246404 RepID=A0A507ER04_9FUNG|nr:hypothetical protein CcCBS67573_g08043 [Chytriomyces confervae]